MSIIIPTYNRSKVLREALDSVFAQTYRDFEVIVCDDGSTDDTEEMIRSLGHPVKYLRMEHTGLPAAARNQGIRAASGELIAFLDSDDQWLPEKLERQVGIFDRHPDAGLVCANARMMDDRVTDTLYITGREIRSGYVLDDLLLGGNFVVTSTAVVRKRLIERAGEFSEEPVLRAAEDFDLWLLVASMSKVFYIPDPLAVYREPGGIHHEDDRNVALPRTLRWLERLDAFVRGHGDVSLRTRAIIGRQRFACLYHVSMRDRRYPSALICVLRWVPYLILTTVYGVARRDNML